jgi:hypothetical protein
MAIWGSMIERTIRMAWWVDVEADDVAQLRQHRFRSDTIRGAYSDADCWALAADSRCAKPRGIRFRILPSGIVH